MENTELKIDSYLSKIQWSEPDYFPTGNGFQLIKKSNISADFWPLWETNKNYFKKNGISIIKKNNKWKLLKRINVNENLQNLMLNFERGKLYDFQKIGVRFIEKNNGRVLISDQMGLGKSIQSLYWLKLRPEIRPAIIVCPASVKLNWFREAKKWLNSDENILVLYGKNPKIHIKNFDIIILNYDILKTNLEFLFSLKTKCLIIDECQYIKNTNTIRTKSVFTIGKKIKHIVALSGTPILNRPIEFFSILNLLRPDIFSSRWKFAIRYCQPKYNGFGWDFSGSSNIDELHKKLIDNLMIRRLKKDVLTELPEKIYSAIPISLTNKTEYKTAENDFLNWLLETEGIGAVKKARRALILTKINKLRQLCIDGKLDTAIQWLDEFLESNNEKLIIFCYHHKLIDKLFDKYKKISVKLDGRDSVLNRQKSIDKFQNDEKTRFFISNIKSGGVGINLTSCSNICFLEISWSPVDIKQAESRCILGGQFINTKHGFKKIENIKNGDFILNSKNEWDAVVNTQKRLNNKMIVTLYCDKWSKPIKTTFDHKFLTQRGWVSAIELKLNDCLINPKSIKNEKKLNNVKNDFFNNDLCFILGFYLGSGFTFGNCFFNTGNCNELIFYHDEIEKDQHLNRIKNYFLKYLSNKQILIQQCDEKTKKLVVRGSEISGFLAQNFGTTQIDKQIPEFVFNFTKNQCKNILEGLSASIGFKNDGFTEFFLTNKTFCSSFIRLLNYIEISFNIRSDSNSKFWVISYKNNSKNLGYKINKILYEQPKKNQFVYDLTISNDHTFCVGNSVVHNCHRIGNKAESINIYFLVAADSIEEKMADIIQSKEKILDQLLDGGQIDEIDFLLKKLFNFN